MKLLNYALRYEKGTLIAAALTGVAGGALSGWTLTLVVEALRTRTTSAALITAFAVVTLGGAAMRYLSAELLTRFSQRRLTELRRELTRRVVQSGLRQVEELGPDRLLLALTEDVGSIATVLASLPVFITHLAIFLACWLYVAWLSWYVWAIGTASIILAVLAHTWIIGRANRLGRQARDEQEALIGHYRALTDGFTELKLHAPRREAFLSRTLHASLDRVARLNVVSLSLYNGAANFNQSMFFVMVGVLVYGATRWAEGDPSTVTGAILAMLYARQPLDTLVNWAPTAMRANVALDKYEGVLAALPAERALAAAVLGPSCQRLDLDGVQYRYAGEDRDGFDLGPIDLTIRAGEILFVTGGNGSGKSTLSKIIAGLYLPGAGRMCVDGRPLDDGNREQYRQLVSSVFPSFHLFRELLGLERPTLDREAASWLARMRLDQRVSVHGGAFSDLNLSTGQRKRVALLVTMLEDRPICIFDEWAADQDAQYREEFYTSLLPELKARGKMLVVISHDDRYYPLGDRVVKLERGRIVFDGPASELAGGGLVAAASSARRPK